MPEGTCTHWKDTERKKAIKHSFTPGGAYHATISSPPPLPPFRVLGTYTCAHQVYFSSCQVWDVNYAFCHVRSRYLNYQVMSWPSRIFFFLINFFREWKRPRQIETTSLTRSQFHNPPQPAPDYGHICACCVQGSLWMQTWNFLM